MHSKKREKVTHQIVIYNQSTEGESSS